MTNHAHAALDAPDDGDVIADLGQGQRVFALHHSGADDLVYLPSGENPIPMHLFVNDDYDSMLDERERAVLTMLLEHAARKLGVTLPREA